MKFQKRSALSATVLACALAHAQPTESTQPASELPKDPQPTLPALDLIDDIDEALARAREAYRARPIAEQVQMKLLLPDGSERSSTITIRIDAGLTNAPGRPRRVFFDLGRLHIAADDNGIIAQTPQEPSLYFQAPITAPLTLPQLWNAIPPVQLPQLEWALADDARYLSRVQEAMLQVTWDRIQTTDTMGVFLAGSSPDGEAMAEFTAEGRLAMLNIQLLGKQGPRVELSVTPLDPQTGPWTLSKEGRQQVPSLADLRAKPPEVVPGARLPALSLMTKDLEAWSLQNDLSQVPPPALRNTPIYGLLVVYRPTSTTGQQDAEVGARAITALSTLLSNAQPDPTQRPRLTSVAIAMMDLIDVNRTKLAAINEQWMKTTSPPARAFSPVGAAEMERIAKGSSAALVVVDVEQKVLTTIPLDGRADPAAIAQEAEAAITAASRLP